MPGPPHGNDYSQKTIVMAVAVYRLPHANQVNLVQGNIMRYQPGQAVEGFVVSQFTTAEVFYIQPQVLEQALSFTALRETFEPLLYRRPASAVTINDPADYMETLNEAIAAIARGAFDKLVIARNRKAAAQNISYAAVLDALSAAFPECLVYIYSSPHTGTWMGATPEKLLIKAENNQARTMALAGTMRSEEPVPLDAWGEKEKAEQDMVAQYIAGRLADKGYAFTHSEVFNFKTGFLNHLCTDFDIDLTGEGTFMQLAALLHPTPAVAGVPQREAVHFIKSEEKFPRECYTGYLGPVSVHNENMLYVNLRCCQVVDDGIVFYAGGGINKGSVAEKELAETDHKMENLQRFFAV